MYPKSTKLIDEVIYFALTEYPETRVEKLYSLYLFLL